MQTHGVTMATLLPGVTEKNESLSWYFSWKHTLQKVCLKKKEIFLYKNGGWKSIHQGIVRDNSCPKFMSLLTVYNVRSYMQCSLKNSLRAMIHTIIFMEQPASNLRLHACSLTSVSYRILRGSGDRASEWLLKTILLCRWWKCLNYVVIK